jgi:hypothetical protein
MKRYEYGYADIANAAGKSAGAVRVDINRGQVDPEDLLSVSIYIVAERLEKERKNGIGTTA